MDLMVIATSWYRLASWSRRLASMRTSTVPEFMLDCKLDNLLGRSGLALVEAYFKDSTGPLGVLARFRWLVDWLEVYGSFHLELVIFFWHSLIGWGWYCSHRVGLHQFRWTWRSYFSWIQTKNWLQVSSAPLGTLNHHRKCRHRHGLQGFLRCFPEMAWYERSVRPLLARLHLLSGQTRKDQKDRLPFPTAWVLLPGHNTKGMGHRSNHKLPYWVGLFHWVASEGLPLALELGQQQLICFPGVGLVRKLPLYRRIEAAMHVMLLAARWPYVMICWV